MRHQLVREGTPYGKEILEVFDHHCHKAVVGGDRKAQLLEFFSLGSVNMKLWAISQSVNANWQVLFLFYLPENTL